MNNSDPYKDNFDPYKPVAEILNSAPEIDHIVVGQLGEIRITHSSYKEEDIYYSQAITLSGGKNNRKDSNYFVFLISEDVLKSTDIIHTEPIHSHTVRLRLHPEISASGMEYRISLMDGDFSELKDATFKRIKCSLAALESLKQHGIKSNDERMFFRDKIQLERRRSPANTFLDYLELTDGNFDFSSLVSKFLSSATVYEIVNLPLMQQIEQIKNSLS